MVRVSHFPLHSDAEDVEGTLSGTVTGASLAATGGPANQGYYSFDGTDDLIRWNGDGTPVDFEGNVSFSISMWVYIDGISGTGFRHIAGIYGTQDSTRQYQVGIDESSGTITVVIRDSANATYQAVNATPPTGEWFHYVGVCDAVNDELRLYLNGRLRGTSSAAGYSINSSTSDFTVGSQDNGEDYFNGDVADVRLYDHALSPEEVSYLSSVGFGSSILVTDDKTFSTTVQPNLQNLDYTNGGGTITLKIIGSPDTGSEEVVEQALGGATSYTLSWSSSHDTFRIVAEYSPSAVTDGMDINTLELVE